ncbi:hypothetical protein ACLB2K_007598 [Fragaria x ananassa]
MLRKVTVLLGVGLASWKQGNVLWEKDFGKWSMAMILIYGMTGGCPIRMLQKITNIPIGDGFEKDRFLWPWRKNGMFIVGSGYHRFNSKATIARDSNQVLITGTSYRESCRLVTEAEASAILAGAELAASLQLQDVIIESDSEEVILELKKRHEKRIGWRLALLRLPSERWILCDGLPSHHHPSPMYFGMMGSLALLWSQIEHNNLVVALLFLLARKLYIPTSGFEVVD